MKELREVQSPWWTTHEAPSKVTGDNRTTKTFYKVHHWAWGAKTGTNDEIDNLYINYLEEEGNHLVLRIGKSYERVVRV